MKLLTAQDVASILKVSVSRVYTLAREKQIPAVKVGERQIRFSEGAILEWIRNGGTPSWQER